MLRQIVDLMFETKWVQIMTKITVVNSSRTILLLSKRGICFWNTFLQLLLAHIYLPFNTDCSIPFGHVGSATFYTVTIGHLSCFSSNFTHSQPLLSPQPHTSPSRLAFSYSIFHHIKNGFYFH